MNLGSEMTKSGVQGFFKSDIIKKNGGNHDGEE